jgi:hypothetical protein
MFRQALLRHPVDHKLLLDRQGRHRAARVEDRADAGLLAEVAHLAVERREQAVVVEHSRAELAGEREQLLHRVGREPLRLGQFVP